MGTAVGWLPSGAGSKVGAGAGVGLGVGAGAGVSGGAVVMFSPRPSAGAPGAAEGAGSGVLAQAAKDSSSARLKRTSKLLFIFKYLPV